MAVTSQIAHSRAGRGAQAAWSRGPGAWAPCCSAHVKESVNLTEARKAIILLVLAAHCSLALKSTVTVEEGAVRSDVPVSGSQYKWDPARAGSCVGR